MDVCSEIVLKKICCTCLSKDRLLFQLCRLRNGLNNLYLLLSYDSEAHREGFFKDAASLYICWECRAIMCRISRFTQQACIAQRHLTGIADGKIDLKQQICLSHLSTHHKITYDKMISVNHNHTDNFIDCGSDGDIKSEIEDDIPLSELHSNFISDNETVTQEIKVEHITKKEKKNKSKSKSFSSITMSEDEIKQFRLSKYKELDLVNLVFKCDSCLQAFKNKEDMDLHNATFHVEKLNHIQCDICLAYIKESLYKEHKENHYERHNCLNCKYITLNLPEMWAHLLDVHSIKLEIPKKRKEGRVKLISKTGNTSGEKKTQLKSLCRECNKYFDNKNQKWKHMQRYHREGYKCSNCEKKFSLKSNLLRHEQLHRGPLPRTECPVCHKLIRVDLLKAHSRIHTEREQYSCAECCKIFSSRASYEYHLKYTLMHATLNIHKYKCSQCDKGYRSRADLRDHVNYQHMGKTQHKCPVCGKALATRRCVARHVRRAHDGVKESAKDKICQQCGKAFRDKRGLREHELIHTGERPLSCELCGSTFRQTASLYTHKKRVHKIFTPARTIQLLST